MQTILILWQENRTLAIIIQNANYGEGNEIKDNTEVWKCNLCVYNDAYILVRVINVTGAPETQVVFKNCAPFITILCTMYHNDWWNNNR